MHQQNKYIMTKIKYNIAYMMDEYYLQRDRHLLISIDTIDFPAEHLPHYYYP